MAEQQGDPMKRLEHIYESGNKRIDQYLEGLRSFYAQQGDLSPTAEKIFDQMQREVTQTRTIRNVAIGLVLLLSGVAGFFYFKKENQEIRQGDYSFLLEKIKASSLPLRLEDHPNGTLSVVLDRSNDLSTRELEALTEIEEAVPSLGRINYLGPAKPLKAFIQEASNNNVDYQISPTTEETTIGHLQMTWDQGSIGMGRSSGTDDRLKYLVNTPIDYFENIKSIDFVLRILDYDQNTQRWKLQFGERQGQTIVWDSRTNYQIRKSANGQIEERPIVATFKDWKNMYIVAIGIGGWGTDEADIDQVKYAWNVNSFAQKIRLD